MITLKELKSFLKQDINGLYLIKGSLLGDSSTQLLAMAIKGEGIRRGYNIDLFESDYSQIENQIYDPSSEFHTQKSKYNIIFQSSHKLLEMYNSLNVDKRGSLAEDRIEFIRTICDNTPGVVILYNYPEIDDAIYGSYSNKVEESFIYQIRKLNFELMNLSQIYSNMFICDIAGIQSSFGRNFVFDGPTYATTDMVLSLDSLPYVATRTLDIIDCIEGHIKKCLILDLDNTIWGGTVGDDGWENIQIGHDLGIGKVFSELQEWIKKLKDRGIIICICSKNDESKAKEPFVKNPHMILRLDDISVFVANWENKVDNIHRIQSILNIGYDSMVFLDDNPFERNMVRENIPEITVPELPEDPADFLEFLYAQNLFETASYSKEDTERTRQYQEESLRKASITKFRNETDYLQSLQMISEVSRFNKFTNPRVAQLTQRSNQFNLRTIRYTEEQIVKIEKDLYCEGFAFSLKDKFGDSGIISVVILVDGKSDKAPDFIKDQPKVIFIDSWIMSCRVLKRGMEYFVLNTIMSWAKSNGYQKIIGEYIPSPKNGMVRDHYSNMGFKQIISKNNTVWERDIDNYVPIECYIQSEGE